MSYESIYAPVGSVESVGSVAKMKSKPVDMHMTMERPATKKNIQTDPKLAKLPNDVAALIDAGSFKMQSVLMMQIGTIVADSLQSKQTAPINHVACHALMVMKMTPSMKTNFIKYTTAFAEYATLQDVRDAQSLIKHWWDVASMNRTSPPFEWFDHTREMGSQLTTIAMCAITMIQVIDENDDDES